MSDTPNPYAHLTAKERSTPSLPVRMLLERKLIQGKVLDFGCGFGKDVNHLLVKGFDAKGYDPHYYPEYPTEKFDTILAFYVLNVLFSEEQNKVLMEISNLLKPTGRAYFAVRRDIQKDGFRTHQVHGKPTYQCYVKLPYTSIFLNENTEFYEYQHWNQVVDRESKCPFCKPSPKLKLLAETPLSYAVLDGYPVAKGHTLIIPKRHVANYFDLTFDEQKDMVQLSNFTQQLLRAKYSTEDFTLGMNIGRHAGQRMDHATMHLIPRYAGDCVNPKGGIRNILNK
ncbi:MAG: HIT domain-containing protein [Bacteroidetes bacterium]|nr:HIT domain-containing protein [Bacteroidota bacterium]